MSTTRQKQERVIEAVRLGLDGDDAVSFIQQSGYAITSVAIARHLRAMDGRGKVQELIEAGNSNIAILEMFFPPEELKDVERPEPAQPELFAEKPTLAYRPAAQAEFSSTKLTVTMPNDVHFALKLAAKVEGKSRSELIVEILEAALSKMPYELPAEDEAE